MADASATGLRRSGLAARTVTVKVRFADFTMVTRSHSLVSPVDTSAAIGAVAGALFDSVDLDRGVRLLGVSLAGFGDPGAGFQLSFDLGLSVGRAEPVRRRRHGPDRSGDEAGRADRSSPGER